jgi:deoxyribonucleoside regulator
LFKTGYTDNRLLRKLRTGSRRAVGDICGRFFDTEGSIFSKELDERTLAIELDSLRKKKLSVAIAGGSHKIDAILGMLRGRYCNVLITDAGTANGLLNEKSGLSK